MRTVPNTEAARFRRKAAQVVDRVKQNSEWSSVTLKFHVLACHAPDSLALFGGPCRYSDQAIEACHVHFDQNVNQYAADTFIESCLANGRRMAMSWAPENNAYNGEQQKTSAPEGARYAGRHYGRRTVAGPAVDKGPCIESGSCANKQAEEAAEWAADNMSLEVCIVGTYRLVMAGTTDADGEDLYEDFLKAEMAHLFSLGRE